jgi:hypothetical protein
VLLRLRVWWWLLWFEKRGTWGASAAMLSRSPAEGSSGTGALGKDRLPFGIGRGLPFATRMESRMGLRRRVARGGGEAASSWGAGGIAARSWRPIEEWLRKERAVSQT